MLGSAPIPVPRQKAVHMGMLDKAKEMLSGHKDQADTVIEKGGDMVDEKTGDKYVGQVDTAQEKAKDVLGGDQQ
jgi:MT0933-like antitoxin protein